MAVYFIQSETGGPIKIGFSWDPMQRLRDMQVGSPTRLRLLATIPGGRDIEKTLHRHYAGLRLHGEWFEPSEGLGRTIQRAAGMNLKAWLAMLHQRELLDSGSPVRYRRLDHAPVVSNPNIRLHARQLSALVAKRMA